MEQRRLVVCNLILFALFLTNKAVTAADNAQNYSSEETLMSTVPVPDSQEDDFQQMLDYLNQTVPRDSTGSSNNSDNSDDDTKSEGAPSPNQLVSNQSPIASKDSLHNTSYVHSGKEVPGGGSYIRAGSAIASAIFVGHFFL